MAEIIKRNNMKIVRLADAELELFASWYQIANSPKTFEDFVIQVIEQDQKTIKKGGIGYVREKHI